MIFWFHKNLWAIRLQIEFKSKCYSLKDNHKKGWLSRVFGGKHKTAPSEDVGGESIEKSVREVG